MRTEGIEMLMERRGREQITFADVADHMADYVGRFPNEAGCVDKLARFLAGVDDVEHDHSVSEIGSDA